MFKIGQIIVHKRIETAPYHVISYTDLQISRDSLLSFNNAMLISYISILCCTDFRIREYLPNLVKFYLAGKEAVCVLQSVAQASENHFTEIWTSTWSIKPMQALQSCKEKGNQN